MLLYLRWLSSFDSRALAIELRQSNSGNKTLAIEPADLHLLSGSRRSDKK